jgi:hypothetical protein
VGAQQEASRVSTGAEGDMVRAARESDRAHAAEADARKAYGDDS